MRKLSCICSTRSLTLFIPAMAGLAGAIDVEQRRAYLVIAYLGRALPHVGHVAVGASDAGTGVESGTLRVLSRVWLAIIPICFEHTTYNGFGRRQFLLELTHEYAHGQTIHLQLHGISSPGR